MEGAVALLFLVASTVGVGGQDGYSSGTWGQQQTFNGQNAAVPQPRVDPYSSGSQNGQFPSPTTAAPFPEPFPPDPDPFPPDPDPFPPDPDPFPPDPDPFPPEPGPEPTFPPDPDPFPPDPDPFPPDPDPFPPDPDPFPPDPDPEPTLPPDPGPPSEDCPPGESSKMIQNNGRIAPAEGEEFFDVTEEVCVQACLANEAPSPDGSPLQCSGYVYTAEIEVCLITSEPIPEGTDEIEAEGSYGRKACYPADLVAPCPGPFMVDPQKTLDDDAGEIEDAATLDECLQKCLELNCASGTFFSEEPDFNCLLNKEVTKATKPELFVDSEVGKSAYFESGCLSTAAKNRLRARMLFRFRALRARRRMRARQHRLKTNQRDELLRNATTKKPVDRKWTLWSRCNNGMQYKYRRCLNRHIRKCPRVMRKCSENENRSNLKAVEAPSRVSTFRRHRAPTRRTTERPRAASTACLAIVGQKSGLKRCSFGGFRFVNGRRRFCKNPVNCP